MAGMGVSIESEKTLRQMMRQLGVYEKDLTENFVRSGGKGGQNVNKVATCVMLVHRPSGIAVKCQRERSQALNRFFARTLLLKRIDEQRRTALREKVARVEKACRQRRRRTVAGKEAMLRDKHAQAEKKDRRRKLSPRQDLD